MNYTEAFKEIILSPSHFYKRMPTTGGYADPLTFAAINLIIYGILSTLIGFLMFETGFGDSMLLGIYGVGQFIFSIIVIGAANLNEFIGGRYYALEYFIILYAIIVPILGFIFLLIGAAILHIIYKILGGTGNFEGTVRFTSYATAVNILALVPILGWIFSFYSLYLYTISGMIVHKVSMGKSVIATFLGTILIVSLEAATGIAVFYIIWDINKGL